MDTKIFIGLASALLVVLVTLYNGEFKPVKSKGALLLVGVVFMSIFFAPRYDVMLGPTTNIGGFWSWQPMFYTLLFLLFYSSVSSINFSDEEIDLLFDIIIYTNSAIALFMILQSINVNQFVRINNHFPDVENIIKGEIGGTFGHPMRAGIFLAMVTPLAVYRKRWVALALMVVAIFLCQSMVGMGSLVVGLSLYFVTKLRLWKFLIPLLMIGLLIFATKSTQIINYIIEESSGRFSLWSNVVSDINKGISSGNGEVLQYSLTGMGTGSFFYLNEHGGFLSAHNEYLQLWSECGLIGALLFICSVIAFILYAYPIAKNNEKVLALLVSFIIISIAAGGAQVYQIEPHRWFTILILGLITGRVR